MPQASNKPLKVLFITRKWPPAIGGMETYSFELSKELEKKVDLSVKFLAGQKNGKPPTPMSLVFFFLKTSFYLLLNRNKYDAVHLGDLVLFPLAWLDAKFSNKHVRFITVHGLDIIYGNRKGIAPFIYRIYMKFICHNAKSIDGFIANSSNTANLAEQKGLTPVYPVPLGVESRDFKLPEQLPTSTPKPFIFFFGRAVKRKGLSWFLNHVLPELPSEVVVLAAGKIWDEEEVATFPENRFQHLGLISDELLTYYCRNSIAVIVPNINNPALTDVEGFGLVTLESASRGGIVLASATEGIVDAVIDTQTGFLVPPEKPQQWVNKINEIMAWDEEQRDQFKANAIKIVKQKYTWNRVANDTLSIYQNIINAK